jgi:hypothetical protein
VHTSGATKSVMALVTARREKTASLRPAVYLLDCHV